MLPLFVAPWYFQYHKFVFIFKMCKPSDLKSLSSLSDVRSICSLFTITCTVTEMASGIVNASNKELPH